MGSVTQNYITKAESTTTITNLVNSQIFDNGTNVGVGTGSPGATVHIYKADGNVGNTQIRIQQGTRQYWDIYTDANEGLYFRPQKSTVNEFPGFVIQDKDSNSKFWLDTNTSVGYFSGNVGIGTTNPGDRLHIWAAGSATNTPQIVQRIFATTSDTPTAGFGAVIAAYTQNSSATTTPQTRVEFGAIAELLTAGSEQTAFVIRTPSAAGSGTVTERVRVQQNGNVGIGTTNATERLTVANTTNVYTDIQGWGDAEVGVIMRYQNGGNGAKLYYNTPNAVMYYDNFYAYSAGFIFGSHDFRSKNSGGTLTSRLFIRGDTGRVGIGTTNPSYALDVVNSGDTPYIRIKASTSSGQASLYIDAFSDGSTHRAGRINFLRNAATKWSIIQDYDQGGVDTLDFELNGTRRVTFNSSGNVGIGTTSISYKLQVNGTMYSAGSSLEYKQDITHYDVVTDKLLQLQPVTYHYKPEYEHLGKKLHSNTQIGLIAEQVAEIFPELAVMKEEDGKWVVRNVDYEKLSILLLSEVQKLRKEVNQLKTP